MNRETVIARLKSLEPQLRDAGVAALYLFGSYARDEARPDSDLDLLVDTTPDAPPSVFGILPANDVVADALPGIDVSMFARDNIVPLYLPAIEASAVRVF